MELQVNQMEHQQKSAMEQEKPNWTRTTFDNYEGKIWCYRIKAVNEYGNEHNKGYYCYNCKNDLFFKAIDKYNRDLPPFRFHKLLVKVLEKKDDDWKTGRKTHSYYAFCCKCAKKDESDGTIKKRYGKLMSFEVEKCDCQEWINKKVKEAKQEIRECKDMLRQSKILTAFVDNLGKERFSESYLLSRTTDILKTEEKKEEYYQEQITDRENYLKLLEEWEIKGKFKFYEPKNPNQ